jgi:hypothetical protein
MNGFSETKKKGMTFRHLCALKLSELRDHADQAAATRQRTPSIVDFRVADNPSVNTFFAGSGF